MSTSLCEELVRGHQADRRAEAERWSRARTARMPQVHRPRTRFPDRVRTVLADALHATARRLEPGGTAVP